MPTLAPRPTAVRSTRSTAASRRWKIALAVLGAVLLHVLFLLLLAWGLPHWPRPPLRHGAGPIELTIVPAKPAPTPEPAGPADANAPVMPPYMRTTDEQKSDAPPPDPNFISDKDTAAASEKPAADPFKPLPTQDGKEMAAFDFDTTPYRPGQEAASAASAAASAEQMPPAPTPAKEKTPDAKKPKPDSKETPTPRPNPVQPTPAPGEFATLKPDPNPADTPPNPQDTPPDNATPPPPPVQDLLARQASRVARENGSVNSTGLPQKPGYQPQTSQSKMSGSVNNRGRSAVAAVGTPLGRYEKAVSDAIGARWYFNVNENMSNLIHTEDVKIHFYVNRSGRIVETTVKGSNQNSVLANISLQAITNAEIPPIPPEVAALLPEGRLEVDYTFALYEN